MNSYSFFRSPKLQEYPRNLRPAALISRSTSLPELGNVADADDIRAGVGEADGQPQSDSPAAAGDEGREAVETEFGGGHARDKDTGCGGQFQLIQQPS